MESASYYMAHILWVISISQKRSMCTWWTISAINLRAIIIWLGTSGREVASEQTNVNWIDRSLYIWKWIEFYENGKNLFFTIIIKNWNIYIFYDKFGDSFWKMKKNLLLFMVYLGKLCQGIKMLCFRQMLHHSVDQK